MEQLKQKRRVAVYIRVSTKEQEEMYWEDLQYSKIEKYIDVRSNDFEFAWKEYIYKDLAVSWADDIDERAWMTRLFDDLEHSKERPFDMVIVYKIDRFARKLSILLDVVEKLRDLWVGFISTQEAIDTDTPFWSAMLWILWVFAELEREMIRERTSWWREETLKSGVWQQEKYWYEKNKETKRPEKVSKEAEVISTIFSLFVDYKMSISQICNHLKNEKIPIPKTNKWDLWSIKDLYKWWDNTIRRFLSDEVYTWIYYFNKTRTIIDPKTKKKKQEKIPKEQWQESKLQHEPIIDKETFEKAQILLNDKKNYSNAIEDYLLSWFLKCDHCKEHRSKWMTQWTWTRSNGRLYYQCSWKDRRKFTHCCEVVPLPKEDLELFVIEKIKDFVANPEALNKIIENSNL